MEKYILVEYLNSFNTVITQTFKSTKRIKPICFDVSDKYIIFGASSGGIYIFKRAPCEFIKLIPSKEGSVLKIAISPNEKHVAIASSKGLVIIVETFIDTNIKFYVHSHHDGSTITDIKWNGNDVYCGDNTGKISIFSLNYLLTIFHTSSAILMQLDSSIVQIDTYLNYLLISTQSRSYLCDTEKEQYKQIGKKIRDGNFGSCFSNTQDNVDVIQTNHTFNGVFRTIAEEEHFTTCLNNTNTKIYCGRPGARIWEVNFEATVLRTYQFKESLTQPPSDLLQIIDTPDSKLTVAACENVNDPPHFNFGLIYPIGNQIVFTYNAEGIYFFDLKTSKLILWNNNFKNIKDIKILNSTIHIWQNNLEISTIALELLENLIMNILLNKQYYLCAELCVNFMEEVENLLDKSKNIHLISILKVKLAEIGATQLLEEMKPILCKLEKHKGDNIVLKKLKNGIVIVDNVYKNVNMENCIPESVQNFACALTPNDDMKIKETDDLEGTSSTQCYEVLNEKQFTSANIEESILLPLYKQYQLNKSHKNAELTESSTLLEENSLDMLLVLFENFVKFVETLDKSDASMWCKEQFLKQAAKKMFDMEELELATLKYLIESFLELNKGISTCKCKFPLPKTHKYPTPYYNLGCKIFNKLDPDYGLSLVPYLYRYKLSKIDNLDELQLPLLIQFSDRSLFEQYINMFTYDTWDEIVKLFIKLKQGVCLNCGEPMDLEGIWSWTNLGVLMIKSIGSENTCRLLKRYSIHIPGRELDEKFYQCCIFSSTFQQPHLGVEFMEKVLNENTSQMFEELMEKYLYRKYLGYQFVTIRRDESSEVPKCNSCELPLNEPIINEIKKCDCGHSFHNLCLISNHGICNVCTTT